MRGKRGLWLSILAAGAAAGVAAAEIGREVSVPRHLADGDETAIGVHALIEHGRQLFAANWTAQEGAGRPLAKGTGAKLSMLGEPLVFPRNFNRISAPDANSCFGCHNAPNGIAGGGGDFVANVFVLAQRFDFANFDGNEPFPTVASHDERGQPIDLDSIANSRASLGMFGSGYIEMLARQMTAELQARRNAIAPGGEGVLEAKGVSFGVLKRLPTGAWDTSSVQGLPTPSLLSTGPDHPPSLVIRPFHQAGAVISLRQFSNNAFNHHHGIQAVERFGHVDHDGDGYVDEMTVADVTAVSIYQATLQVPGRVIPRDPEIEQAVLAGESAFARIGCNDCHVERLPLTNRGWIYSEPNPYNPNGNLQPGERSEVRVNLNAESLPGPRLRARDGVTWVPAYTDLKLHDITSGPDDPNREPLDMQFALGSSGFFAGNGRFLTRKLWGAANEPPYFHHGKFTTLREAILAHAGEAEAVTARFRGLSSAEQDEIVEFLKTLQILAPGTRSLVVDERGRPRSWPPR